MFASGLKRTTLASQTYVQEQVSANLPTGTIYSLTLGYGLSIGSGGSAITTEGQINLEAEVGDLVNVSSAAPLSDQILGWNSGTSMWEPMTFLGSGTSSLQWDDITNAQNLVGNSNYIMKVNNDADGLEFVQNQLVYAPNFIAGQGITHTATTTSQGATLRIDAKLSEIFTTTDSNSATTMVIVDENDNQRRIQLSDVSLGHFSNPASDAYLRNSGVSTVDPIYFDTSSQTFSLTNERYRINFDIAQDYGISGVLPIESGGTSASSASQARINLGLSYNSDVMTYQDPQFIGEMHGTDILIRPYYLASTALSITVDGSGYNSTDDVMIVLDSGDTFLASITTGASEELTAVTANNSSGHQDYLNWNLSQTGTVKQGSNETGEVTFESRTGYLNFGQVTGYSGYGMGYDGQFWFRESGGNWLNTIPFDLEDATNVQDTPSTTEPGSLLIYDGSEWRYQEMWGDMTIDESGQTTITTGAIDPTQILATFNNTTVEVDRYEFGTLYDINTGMTIQGQLDNGVSVSDTPSDGDMIYFNGTDWKLLQYEASGQKTIIDTGISTPSWDFISSTYVESDAYVAGDNILYLDDTFGTSTTLYTDMGTILEQHSGGTGGIVVVSNILSTDISTLPTVTSFNTSNYILAVNDPNTATPLDEQIGVSAFLDSVAGSGLTTSGAQLQLDTATSITPDTDVTYSLGSSSNAWDRVFLQRLNLNVFANLASYSGSPEIGEVIFLEDDGGGSSVLVVYTSSGWMKINLSSF